MLTKVDAIIVGARCAGAATALLLARAGARVLAIDRGTYGSDTLSTHALMRGGVLQLHRWGLLPRIVAAGTPAVRATTFRYPGQEVRVDIEARHGVEALYAPRRAVLDRILVDAAREAGADVRFGTRLDALIGDGARVRGATIASGNTYHHVAADIVIGADGRYSTLADRVGAADIRTGQHASGVLYGYWRDLPVDGYQWWFRPGISGGAIPTDDDATCVFASVPSDRFHSDRRGDATVTLRRWVAEVSPEFAERLSARRQIEPTRGFGGQAGFIRRSVGPGWALVGDAGYFKDPITSHGITDALRDAELLARAIRQGTSAGLAAYERTRFELSERLFDLTDRIAAFDWTEEQLQSLHRDFSREMSREVRALVALDSMPAAAQVA